MELSVCKLCEPIPSFPDHPSRELSFLLDHVIDFFFNRSGTYILIHSNRLSLADTKDAVRRLVFHRWIPPSVKMEHMVGLCKSKTCSSSLKRENENRGAIIVILKALDHKVAFFLGYSTMKEKDFLPSYLFKMYFENIPHLKKLRKD